jgi:DNA-binding winged helix-turn-helix (wHTH) protein
LLFRFEDFSLDTDRRELRRGGDLVSVEPQVFDLLVYLIRNCDRVVSKDDMIAAIWAGRIVSESALTNRINAARTAVGDSGEQQRLIKTLQRKGIRFVGEVHEQPGPWPAAAAWCAGTPWRKMVQVKVFALADCQPSRGLSSSCRPKYRQSVTIKRLKS